MAGIQVDGANQKLVLDSDGDTYLEAATDDTVKVYVAGAQDFTITANTLTAESGSTIAAQALTATTVTASGILKTDDATEATSTTDGSLQTDGGLSVVKDAVFGDDVKLLSDASVIAFGADGDTTLTHTDGTGLTLNSTNKLCFNDATQYIQGASGTVLDIAATDEIELTATLLDVNANLDVSGTSLLPTLGVMTAKDLGQGIHIRASDSSATVTANEADFLVIEKNSDSGMSILSATDGTGNIYFGDSGDNDIGKIQYSHGSNVMYFTVNAAERMRIRDDGNINLPLDDVGFSFGASQDLWFGGYAGEEGLQINRGDSQVANPLGSGGGGGAAFIFYNPGTSAAAEVQTVAGEGKSASINLKQDQHDNPADQWWMGQQSTDFAANDGIFWTDYDASSADNEMRLTQAGELTAEGAMNASTTIDYAEYFEWKTELANDDKITETYGLSVVLDNGKVRLAEAGEEAKVLGVVRPNNTSAMVGGAHSFKYKGKYEKNVWGEPVRENWTQVTWNETRTKYWKDGDNLPEGKSVGDVRGTYVHGHVYPKDRIPSKVLKPEWELDRSEPNWRTLASNLTSEDLVVPSTDSEKSAANYTERSTYKRDKGDGHKKGDKLTRKKVNASYDPSLTYTPREKRRKEWCIVGLIGQVQVRDTAIIPTHWTKLKNLETGIDMYYVFNK